MIAANADLEDALVEGTYGTRLGVPERLQCLVACKVLASVKLRYALQQPGRRWLAAALTRIAKGDATKSVCTLLRCHSVLPTNRHAVALRRAKGHSMTSVESSGATCRRPLSCPLERPRPFHVVAGAGSSPRAV